MSPRCRKQVEAGLYLAGLLGLIVAVRQTAGSDAIGDLFKAPAALAVALVACLVAQIAAGGNWILLTGVRGVLGASALRAIYSAQLAKYVPAGGVVQVVSQVTLTQKLGLSWARVSLAVLVANGQIVLAGLAVGTAAAVDVMEGSLFRPLAFALPLVVAFTARPVLKVLVAGLKSVWSKIPSPENLPPSGPTLGAMAAAVVNFVALSTAFAVVLSTLDGEADLVIAGSAFALAWVAGFAVLPLPGGIGVREVVLIALLPQVDDGAILAAALALRSVTLLAEFIAWILAIFSVQYFDRRGSSSDPTIRATLLPD